MVITLWVFVHHGFEIRPADFDPALASQWLQAELFDRGGVQLCPSLQLVGVSLLDTHDGGLADSAYDARVRAGRAAHTGEVWYADAVILRLLGGRARG